MSRLADDLALWPAERRTVRPPEALTVSEWADRYRRLDPINCARPGPWRTDFAPFLRGILDAFSDPECEDIVLMGGTQWGKTESMINMLLWTIDQEPMPTLYVMPDEDSVISFGNRRLKIACEYCSRVEEKRTDRARDWQNKELAFEGMMLYLGWATSAAKLASRSIGRLFMDELDKFPAFTGKEADPISLATERLRWYHDRKRVLCSTPTTTDGYIWNLWLEGDQRWYHVPCPFCGHFQRLHFSRETVVWPEGERDPERIREHRLAKYVCESCEREIPDDDNHKRRMLLGGVWCPDGGEVQPDGRVKGVDLKQKRRSFHVNALYSPVLTFSDVAAEFLRSKNSETKLLNFTNSWIGWPWIERTEQTSIEDLMRLQDDRERALCPSDTVTLTAGVDVQEDEIYYAVRAWRTRERSSLVEAGRVRDFAALAEVLVHTGYTTHDGRRRFRVRLALVDSGYRTDVVYRFAIENEVTVRAIKGQARMNAPLKTTKIERDWIGRPGGIMLWHVDTHYFKNKLNRHIHAKSGETGSWRLHAAVSEEYLRQMTSEHRVLVRPKGSKTMRQEWTPKAGGAANHWWDCEVYNVAAAEMLDLWSLREDEPSPQMVANLSEPATQEELEADEHRRTMRQASRSHVRRSSRGRFIRRKGSRD